MRIAPLLVVLLIGAQVHAQAAVNASTASRRDPAIQEAIDRIEAALKDPNRPRDDEVLAGLADLKRAASGTLHPADEGDIVRAAGCVAGTGTHRDPDHCDVVVAAAAVLGKLGHEGACKLKNLFKAERFPHTREWQPLHATFVREIGETHDERMIDFLIGLVKNADEPQVAKEAGGALGNFAYANGKLRRDIVKEIVTTMAGLEGKASTGKHRQNAQRALNAVRSTWNHALQRLTGQSFTHGTEWQHWWNKNKNNSKQW